MALKWILLVFQSYNFSIRLSTKSYNSSIGLVQCLWLIVPASVSCFGLAGTSIVPLWTIVFCKFSGINTLQGFYVLERAAAVPGNINTKHTYTIINFDYKILNIKLLNINITIYHIPIYSYINNIYYTIQLLIFNYKL